VPVRVDAGLQDLEVPEFDSPRQISSKVHAHLRRLINDGVIAAGTELNQADLARQFKVSRIPMREAFRMLQQEGLIDVQVNQRATVRALDAGEVDQLYGVRISLEALGARITAGRLTPEEVQEARQCLRRMNETKAAADMTDWMVAHRRFHALCTARTGEPMARIILPYSERTERYVRFGQRAHPDSFATAAREHKQILAALVAGDVDQSGSLMALHLEHTAQLVVGDLDASFNAITVRESLHMSTLGRL
jgi:DNA-binding GntR family transcriptional regulator